MKVFIAYESKYGNGKKCVDHLQSVIIKKGHEAHSFSVRDIKPSELPEADLYVFSSPTQIGKPAGKMRKFLKKIDVKQEGVKYAVMVTHMDPNAKTLEKMEALLQDRGIDNIAKSLKIKVNGMKGPLEEGYKEKIEAFASELVGGQ